MSIASPITAADLAEALRAGIGGDAVTPDDPAFAAAGFGFSATTLRGAEVIVIAARAADVAVAVRVAARAGRRVAIQLPGRATGNGEVLIVTRLLAGVSIDPLTRTATVGVAAGWSQVLDAAEPFGLFAVAAGSELDPVGRPGLGGRLPRLAPAQVVALQIATAGGDLVWLDAADDPDLFDRLRVGGGSLGSVTAMTIDLVPLPALVAGDIWLPSTPQAMAAWREWAAGLPPTASTSVTGGTDGHEPGLRVRFAHVGDPAGSARMLADLRAVTDVLLETVSRTPWSTVTDRLRCTETVRDAPVGSARISIVAAHRDTVAVG